MSTQTVNKNSLGILPQSPSRPLAAMPSLPTPAIEPAPSPSAEAGGDRRSHPLQSLTLLPPMAAAAAAAAVEPDQTVSRRIRSTIIPYRRGPRSRQSFYSIAEALYHTLNRRGDSGFEGSLSIDSVSRYYMTDPDFIDYLGNGDSVEFQMLRREISVQGRQPAARSVSENLPSIVLTEESGVDTLCAVCTDEMCLQEAATQLPCLHHYHGDCILRWLRIRNTCPLCRYELPTEDDVRER